MDDKAVVNKRFRSSRMFLTNNIETPRLLIRSWRDCDKEFTLSLWGDKENGKYMSDPSHEHIDDEYLRCVDKMENSPDGYYMLIELKNDGSRVGTCCVFPDGDRYDIGYCIAKSHWREGLGSEMLETLIRWIKADGGRSITGEVANDNEASVALLRKYGFNEDRKSIFKKWGEETCFDATIFKLELS